MIVACKCTKSKIKRLASEKDGEVSNRKIEEESIKNVWINDIEVSKVDNFVYYAVASTSTGT